MAYLTDERVDKNDRSASPLAVWPIVATHFTLDYADFGYSFIRRTVLLPRFGMGWLQGQKWM